jgi:hypothetical protein
VRLVLVALAAGAHVWAIADEGAEYGAFYLGSRSITGRSRCEFLQLLLQLYGSKVGNESVHSPRAIFSRTAGRHAGPRFSDAAPPRCLSLR